MKKTMKHKGFLGSVETSFEDNCLHGELLFINDKIIYEGATPSELHQEFINAVDDYIEVCRELGREPNKPFSGSFNVRIPASLHEQASKKAYVCDMKLNEFVREAILEKVAEVANSTVHHVHHHDHRLEVKIPDNRQELFGEEGPEWEPEIKSSMTLQ